MWRYPVSMLNLWTFPQRKVTFETAGEVELSVVTGEVTVKFKTLLVVAVVIFITAVLLLLLAVWLIVEVNGGLHWEISEQGLAIAEEVVEGFRSGPVQPNVWRNKLVNTLEKYWNTKKLFYISYIKQFSTFLSQFKLTLLKHLSWLLKYLRQRFYLQWNYANRARKCIFQHGKVSLIWNRLGF